MVLLEGLSRTIDRAVRRREADRETALGASTAPWCVELRATRTRTDSNGYSDRHRSGGLIGSEAVKHFVALGHDVIGVENDMRGLDLDIRDGEGIRRRTDVSVRRADHRDDRAGAGPPSAEPAATARRIRRRMHVRAS